MISVKEARSRLLAGLAPLGAEQVPLAQALGRVIAEDVAARLSHPPAAVSSMDGYALRAADVAKVPATLPVIGESAAGHGFQGHVESGQAVRIFTGAPLPAGADAVVMQEKTKSGAGSVTILESVPQGKFVRPAGMDFAQGQKLLPAERRLTARDLALCAAMNVPWLMVRRKPRIAIISTGDELAMPGDPMGPSQIVSSNGVGIAAIVRAVGGEPIDLGICKDDRQSLLAMAEGAKGADMLVTSGGASVGDHDLVKSALGEGGLEVAFHKVAMRPGKPLMFGRIGGTPMLGLPGNPVSALVCSLLFLAPAIQVMLGLPRDEEEPGPTARLIAPLPANDERQDYLRARLTRDAEGALVVAPFKQQDSGMMSALALADCLVIRPPHAPAAEPGDLVPILPLSGGALSI